MRRLRNQKEFWAVLLVVMSFFPALAQEKQDMLSELPAEKQKTLEALALYPEQVRNAILNASQFPQLLVKIANIQEKTRESFKQILVNIDRESQEKIWDIARYPELITIITEEGSKSDTDFTRSLGKYPVEVQKHVMAIRRQYADVFKKINQLNRDSEQNFESLIKDQPDTVISTFRQLIKLPDVLTILTENMSLTLTLGEMYRENPDRVKSELADLNLQVTRRQAQAVQDWRKELEQDPDALEELKQSTEEYAREQGYDLEKIREPYREDKKTTVQVYVNPYPYWFGYPYWYSHPRWYPYPYWYDWGFYYGPEGTIVIMDMPSYYYVDWHFRRYYHIRRYPVLSNRFIYHYRRYPKRNTGISRGVSKWDKEKFYRYPVQPEPRRVSPPGKVVRPRAPIQEPRRTPPLQDIRRPREYHRRTWETSPPVKQKRSPSPTKPVQKKRTGKPVPGKPQNSTKHKENPQKR